MSETPKAAKHHQTTLLLSDEMLFATHRRQPIMQKSELRDEIWPLYIQVVQGFITPFLNRVCENPHDLYFRETKSVKNEETGLFKIGFEMHRLPYGEFQKQLESNCYSALWTLRDSFSAIAAEELLKFCRQVSELPDDNELKRGYVRLSEVILGFKKGALYEIEKPDRVPAFLHTGLITGINVSFDILRAIPLAIYRQQQRVPGADEFSQCVQSSKSLIMTLSAMHLVTFSSLRNLAKSLDNVKDFPPPPRAAEDYELPARLFEMNEAGTSLAVRADYLYHWRKEVENFDLPSHERLGCPARMAKIQVQGSSGFVIPEVYRVLANYLSEHLLPRMDAYIKSAPVELTVPKIPFL